MKKKDEVAAKASCLNRAEDDEMIFVLLGRDLSAPVAIRAWCENRVMNGDNKWEDAQITEALKCADEMVLYRNKIKGKV